MSLKLWDYPFKHNLLFASYLFVCLFVSHILNLNGINCKSSVVQQKLLYSVCFHFLVYLFVK